MNKGLTEKSLQSGRNSRCKSPEAGALLECLKIPKRRLVWQEKREWKREEDKVREVTMRPDHTE